MDGPRDYYTKEVSLTKTNIIWYHIFEIKYDTNELIYKTETDSETSKPNLWLPKLGGGIN